jgi:serine/threonine protein phosphatase PrpC
MTQSPDSLQFGPGLDVAAHSSAAANPALRLENQDNYLLIDTTGCAAFLRGQSAQRQQVPHWPAGHARIAVLDGMGGHGMGREAAEAVVAGLLAMPACASLGELAARLDALHTDLQHHFASDDAPARRPGTTLTLLELRPGRAPLLYHVGDSRLYEISASQVTPMTVDHVPATAFALGGLLDEREWWQQVHAEHRSQISQAFILGNAFANPTILSDPLFPLSPLNLPAYLQHLSDRRAIELRAGMVYLLATDGFWSCDAPSDWVLRWPELFAGRSSAREMSHALFQELGANPPCNLHADNITAIVLRVNTMNKTT